MTRCRQSYLNIGTGSDLCSRKLPIMGAGSGDGPVVWLTAGVHGDEPGGTVIIQEVFKRLERADLAGTVYAFPVLNPIGFEMSTRGVPVSHEDMNRSFPGDKDGSLAERIAAMVMKKIKKTNPAVVIDLHNDWQGSIPYVILDAPTKGNEDAWKASYRVARSSGFLITMSTPEEMKMSRGTIGGVMLKSGIPAITAEVGGFQKIFEDDVELGVAAVFNVLSGLGMVDAGPRALGDWGKLSGHVLSYCNSPRSKSSGILRFLAKPGDTMKKGQEFATVSNSFGEVVEILKAEKPGIILGLVDRAVTYSGNEVIALAYKE